MPVQTAPAHGPADALFQIYLAEDEAPAGLLHELQVRRPGTGSFATVASIPDPVFAFTPDAGPGTYIFRARVTEPGVGATGWSPQGSITVP